MFLVLILYKTYIQYNYAYYFKVSISYGVMLNSIAGENIALYTAKYSGR